MNARPHQTFLPSLTQNSISALSGPLHLNLGQQSMDFF